MIIYFLRGSLPWQGLKIKTKEERYKKILEKKREISSDDLCRDYPEEFKYYIDYTKELGYNENPNYDKLKKNFLFLVREKMCENFDFIYDWTSSNDLKKRERNLDILLIGDSDNNSGNINNNCFKEEQIIKYNTNKNVNNENNKEQIKLENIDNEVDEENPNNMAKTENNLAKNEKEENKENVESTCCQM